MACLLASALSAAACNDSNSIVTAVDGVSVPVSQITVQPKVDTIFARDTLQLSDAIQLKAIVVGFSGTVLTSPTVRWSTADTGIVTVDSLGVVRPKRLGTATVVARSGNKQDEATVVVVWATRRITVASDYRSVTGLTATTDTIFLGDQPSATDFVRLRGIAIGPKGDTLTGVAFRWESLTPTVATVDPTTGIVRPTSQTSFGTATIRVTGADMEARKQVVVLPAVRGLNVDPATDTIFVNDPIRSSDTRQLSATPVLWASAPQSTPVTVRWSTANAAIAVVDAATGVVTARGLGTTRINATAAGLTQGATVSVLPTVRQVTVTPTNAGGRVVVGDTLRLVASAVGYDGQPVGDVAYKWMSSNPSVATIDSTGLVRFLAPGQVQFSATGDFVTGTTTPNVTVLANTYQSITAGTDYSCAIGQLGRLDCWGRATEGQLGTSGDSTCFAGGGGSSSCTLHPKRAAAPEAFVALSAGAQTTCGISALGRAYCWGVGQSGEIGNGQAGNVSTPTLVTSGVTFALSSARTVTLNGYTTYLGTISAGGSHACGIAVSGVAFCWGADDDGQLGDGTFRTFSSTPIPVGGLSGLRYVYISAGENHTCALTAAGTANCWGSNAFGQLGVGSTGGSAASPGPVETTTALAMISAGLGDRSHTCGVSTVGALLCWGSNESGQVTGTASATPISTPTAVGPTTYTTVSAGVGFTCALRTDGSIDCWGRNEAGQLGTGSLSATAGISRVIAPAVYAANGVPSTIPQVTYVAVAAGQRHACGLATDGWVYCWGSDVVGALGDQFQAIAQSRPIRVYRAP